MTRYSHYDTDAERLPDGMRRIGYDADTQVYTFQDSDGSYWESAPGCEYGQLTRAGADAEDRPSDTEPFLMPTPGFQQKSWRTDLMPLLNFGVLIGVFLLGLFWYLHFAASGGTNARPACSSAQVPYVIRQGDTCWAIGNERGLGVDDMVRDNVGLDCDRLQLGSVICLPK
ncbi:peptidoglycan-binding LysM [Moelleriella libera RCEF 2490]|uniref:Peptidoglycan-binding LysM n=1 Tax=Moelleriella libera RCEF 2490 TaxID=1081109 RepID=A0A167YIZ4_9HYPO|nr:peptidoglycan-binding LysM [Moelleriella libera RCEF 2490]